MESQHTFSQWLANAISGGAILASWVGLLPTIMTVIASGVALIWYAIQIYESETVKKWRKRRMLKKLVCLHQMAGELEMRLVDTTDSATLEHLKKAISMRVDIDAGLQKRETTHEKANMAMVAAAAAAGEKKLSSPKAAD